MNISSFVVLRNLGLGLALLAPVTALQGCEPPKDDGPGAGEEGGEEGGSEGGEESGES